MKGHDIEFNYETKVLGIAEANCSKEFNNGLELDESGVNITSHNRVRSRI